jgi:hypothetical protein
LKPLVDIGENLLPIFSFKGKFSSFIAFFDDLLRILELFAACFVIFLSGVACLELLIDCG